MKSIPLSILSALLLILCFPRFDIWYLAWFALVPLLFAIRGKSLKTAFALCYLFGAFFCLGVFHWLSLLEGVGLKECIILDLYVASYFGLFGLLYNLISRNARLPSLVIAPVIWVSLEYARYNAGFLKLPLVLMGHSQYLNIPLIQISGFTGVYGVSFLIVMVNVAISDVIHDRSRAFKPTIATIIVLVISLAYGLSVITKGLGRDTASITIIQPNIPQQIKWKNKFKKQNFEKHVQVTKEASNNGDALLIVWPESVIHSLRRDIVSFQTILNLVRETKTHFLVGSSQSPKFGSKEFRRAKRFVSAFLISPDGDIKVYNKILLVPFGEYLPYKDLFPWPSKYDAINTYVIPGSEYTIFDIDGIKFGTTICWENEFSEHFRQFVKNGANFMVNITNEAMFEDTEAAYHHAVLSVFRAAENRISVVRCANTGVSSFIDPYGKVLGTVRDHKGKETFVDGYLTKEIPLMEKRTFYTMYGDVFVYTNLIMATVMLILSFLKIRRGDSKEH